MGVITLTKKLFIFDFDGTLVNTFYDSVIAYNKALEQHGREVYHYDKLEDLEFDDFIENMTRDEEILETYGEIYTNSNMEYTKPYPGIMEVLETLDNNPEVELAICSNRIQNLLDMLTERLFSNINFKYVIGYNEGGYFKPNPEMMNQILDHENYSRDEIIYIGDRGTDIKTAKNSNLDLILVTWGQGNSEAYNDSYPLKVIDNPKQLLNL